MWKDGDECMLLVGLDRDGTLLPNYHYLGKEENWKDLPELFPDTIEAVQLLKKHAKVFVATNQSGMAMELMSEER